jgi:hypothetical protein
MTKSNAAEIRRVRHRMSAEADHNVRNLIAMLSPLRERVRKRLVDHGGKAKKCDTHERPIVAESGR